MLGSTQTVDMETTRQNNFGRVFIAVLNPLLIPPELDVVIGDHYFELEFEVEKMGIDENGEEVLVEWKGGEGGEGKGEEGKGFDSSAKRDPKRHKSGEETENDLEKSPKGQNGEQPTMGTETLKQKVHHSSQGDFSAFLKETAEAIIDIAVSRELDVMAEKIMAENLEEVGELQMTIEGKNVADQLGLEAASQVGNKGVLQREVEEPVVQLEEVSNREGIQMGATLTAATKKIGSGGSARALTSSVMEGQGVNPAMGELLAAAAIPEALVTPTRASPRLTQYSDEHILTRVERRTAEKNWRAQQVIR